MAGYNPAEDDDKKKKEQSSSSGNKTVQQKPSQGNGTNGGLTRVVGYGEKKTRTGANGQTITTTDVSHTYNSYLNKDGTWKRGTSAPTYIYSNAPTTSAGVQKRQQLYNRNRQQQQQQPVRDTRVVGPQNAIQQNLTSKATQYGLNGVNGLTTGAMPDIAGDGKWWAGEEPTDIEYAARIYAVRNGDQDMMNQLYDKRFTKGDSAYRAYAGITSPAVAGLHQLGYDVSNGLTDEWFEQNRGLSQYLQYTDTGSIKKPKKHASKEEWAAYYYAQALGDKNDTDKAETELAALREEIGYYAGSAKNLSDAEIASRINWSNYPTLQKMDQAAGTEKPTQLVRRVDWSQDYLNGMIWAARKGGGSGDAFTDAVYERLGYGNWYQPDEATIKKRTRGTPEYAPYSLGPVTKEMEEAGMYFGKHTFTNQEVEELANAYYDKGDPNADKMIQRIQAANDFTVACEEEYNNLLFGELDEEDGKRYGGIDDKITEYLASNDITEQNIEEDLDALADKILADGDFKNLEKLQSSMDKMSFKDTTRPIGFTKENLKRMLRDKITARIESPTVEDATNDTKTAWDRIGESIGGLFSPKKKEEPNEGELVQWKGTGDAAVRDAQQKTADSATGAVMDSGTTAEKTTWRTSEVGQQEAADSMVPYVKDGIPTGAGAEVYYNLTGSDINGTDYINNRTTINNYDGLTNQKKSLEDRLRQIEEEQNKRHNDLSYGERMDMTLATVDENAVRTASAGVSDVGGEAFGKPAEEEKLDIENMSVSQKAAWLNERMLAPSVTPEEYGEMSFLRDRYLDSATLPPEQRQALDEELAQYMSAVQPSEDAELIGLRNDAVAKVARLNPDMKGASFEEAAEWLAKQSGDSNAFLDAKDAVETANITADLRVIEMQQNEMQGAYDEAYDYMRKLQEKYATLDTMWKITGSGGEYEQPVSQVLDYISSNFADYIPYPYDDTNYYDDLVRDGKSDNEVYAEAKKNNTEYRAIKDYIQGCLDACNKNGVDIPEDYRKNMERAMNRLDNLIADGNYYALRHNGDFDTFVGAQKEKEYEQDPTQTPDLRAQFDFMTDEQWQLANLPGTDFSPANIYAMTEDERNTLWYIYGKQKAAGAQKYYNHLTDEYGAITTRRGQAAEEDLYNAFRTLDKYTGNVAGTAATVIGHPAQIMGGLYTGYMWATGREANPNSSFFALPKASAREREAAKEDIATTLTGQFGEGWWVDLATKGYDAVTSSADNIFDAVLMGGAGKMLGIASPLVASEGASIARKFTYNVINGTITALPLGISAGGMAYVDAIGRGLPPEKAYILAGASTLAESITEGLEIESIIDAYSLGSDQGFKQGLKGLIEEVLTSAVNEAVGEGAGSIFEQGVDDYVAGKQSTRNQLKEQYRRQGLTGDALESAVNKALVQNVVNDMIMGAASGMLSTSFSGTVGGIQNTLATRKADKANARWNEILSNENSRMNEILYNEFKQKNSEYLTNLENGYIDLGFAQEDAHQMVEDYAKTVFDELKAATPESVAEKQAAALEQAVGAARENQEVFNGQMETAVEESQAVGTYDQNMGLDEIVAEIRGEPRTNPRTQAEVDNFEISPLNQYDELVDKLTDEADKGFDGSTKSEAVSTLQAVLSYTAQAEDATDPEAKAALANKAQAASRALDDILARRGIDKAHYRFLDNVESMMQLREMMTAETQGPVQQLQTELDQAEEKLAEMLETFDGSEEAQAAINEQSDAVNALAEQLKNRRPVDALADQARAPQPGNVQGPVQAVRQAEE